MGNVVCWNKDKVKLGISAVQHVQAELRKLEARGLSMRKAGRLFIRCPFHNEKTPSCLVTDSPQSKHEIGSFKCLGCGKYGFWNTLAKEMGLEEVNQFNNVAKTAVKYETKFYDRLVEERHKGYKDLLGDLLLTEPSELPEKGKWRTIPYLFLKELRICQVKHFGKTNLFMPAYMGGELAGGIRAVVTPNGQKNELKYQNSSGEWSREKGLYPFDHVSKKMNEFEKDYGFRGLALVEGARDSLCMNCEGIPTLGLLGTQSWSIQKRDRVLDLDPDFIILVLDGDSAGAIAEDKIWKDLRGLVPCKKMALSRFSKALKRDIDPGNAPPEVIQKIWETLHQRKPSSR